MPDWKSFSYTNLAHYVHAYDQFVGDVRDLVRDPANLPQQLSLKQLESFIYDELQRDVEHQLYWWHYYDRANESLPLLESDGPQGDSDEVYGSYGVIDRDAYDNIRRNNIEEPYINLVASNVKRKLDTIKHIEPTFYPEAHNPQFDGLAQSMNAWTDEIKDATRFGRHFWNMKFQSIVTGRGVIKFEHGPNMESPDFARLKRIINKRDFMTPQDVKHFEDVFEFHDIQQLETFDVINYRGAYGTKGTSYENPMHRQVHWFENVSVEEARMRYPDIADDIHSGIDELARRVSPHIGILKDDLNDIVTISHHQIKFPVVEDITMNVSDGMSFVQPITKEKPRYAIGHIEIVHNAGIGNMSLDYYDHNRFNLVQWVSFPSTKHSCGIGIIKFGRDPQIIHNRLHSRMLEYFGRQVKGGGFLMKGLLTQDQMTDLAKGNRWVEIDFNNLPPAMRNRKNFNLGDVLQDNRPPAFPSAYSALMQLEETATDRSMSSPDTWKGIAGGKSGVQEQYLGNQANAMHTNAAESLRHVDSEMGHILHNNVVQFDGNRPIKFFRTDHDTGEKEYHELNIAMDIYPEWDQWGKMKMKIGQFKNHIGTFDFTTKTRGRSITPSNEVERHQWALQNMQIISNYTQSEAGLELLKVFAKDLGNSKELNEAIKRIDIKRNERRKIQSQLADREEQKEQFEKDRQFKLEKEENRQNLFRLHKDLLDVLLDSDPEALSTLMNNPQALRRSVQRSLNELNEAQL